LQPARVRGMCDVDTRRAFGRGRRVSLRPRSPSRSS
jgi:hypothetical protein